MAALAAPFLEPEPPVGSPPELPEESTLMKTHPAARLACSRRVIGGAAAAALALCAVAGLLLRRLPDEGVRAQEAALAMAARLRRNVTPTALALQNAGQDCWVPCGSKAGYCEWCGPGNMCCKEGDPYGAPECEQALLFTQSFHHECVAPHTESTDSDAEWLQCITYTGGTCNIFGCSAERGPTTCERWGVLFHYCICEEGYCADIAGRCVKKENSLVAASVTFRNAQWPDYKMYFSSGSGIMVGNTIDPSDPSAKFNIYQVPSFDGRLTQVMLGSVQYPSFVATTISVTHCPQHHHHGDNSGDDYGGGYGGGYGNDYGGNGQGCWQTYNVVSQRVNKMDMSNIVKLTEVGWEQKAYIIQGAEYPGRAWYIPSWSWSVDTYWGDPGPAGYWIPDPPLPPTLHFPRVDGGLR